MFLVLFPKTYKAATLILLEPQRIPETFVPSTITETMESRLRNIKQQICSRTNLEGIIQKFQLDQKPSEQTVEKIFEVAQRYLSVVRREKPPQEGNQTDRALRMMKLVEKLREGLTVATLERGPGGGGHPNREESVAFEISFEWGDQELVAPVTNGIAARFIEDNLFSREERAMSTTDFLDKEALAIRGELEIRERELESFKKEHMGMLPDQLESNISILNQLREELLQLEGRLEQEKYQANLIRSQAQTAQIEHSILTAGTRPDRQRRDTARREDERTSQELTSGSLDELERELKRLSSLYSNKHPDIVLLKRHIDIMKKEGSTRDQGGAGDRSIAASQDRINVQLVPVLANIESYKTQISEVQKQIENYKERVERTPQVEMELNKVLRDYETVRRRYDSLLSKKLDAKLAEQMEKRKQGETFKVLDPAIKPPKPFKPNGIRVMAMTLALGLGLGGGLAYLREMLDPHFYNPEEVTAFLDVEVIVSLPLADAETRS